MSIANISAADRQKALAAALGQIDKAHGKGSVMKIGDRPAQSIGCIPTGAITLDAALGIGGIPRGRITEIYGPESSGKTTVCLHLVANVQKAGGIAAFIDAEHALDVEYARKLGVDVENLLLSQPDTGEQGLDIAEKLVRSGAVDLIIVDSVAALTPKAEIEGDIGDSHVGLQARMMSQAMRKLTGAVASTDTAIVFINQLREKVGISWGSPEVTTGGKALKFYASVRMDIRRKGPLKDKEEVVGSETRVKVVKNKVAPPFKEAMFDIRFAHGIDAVGTILNVAVENGIVDKSGAWYAYKGQKIGQGAENSKRFLGENPAILAEIETTVRGILFKNVKPAALSDSGPEVGAEEVDLEAED